MVGTKKLSTSMRRTSTPPLNAWRPLTYDSVLMELVGVVDAVLRQVHGEADGGAAVGGVEPDQPQLVDLDGGDLLRRRVGGAGRRVEVLVAEARPR